MATDQRGGGTWRARWWGRRGWRWRPKCCDSAEDRTVETRADGSVSPVIHISATRSYHSYDLVADMDFAQCNKVVSFYRVQGWTRKTYGRRYDVVALNCFNPNSPDNKCSWRILKDFYCSVTMLRELGLMLLHILDMTLLFWRDEISLCLKIVLKEEK